MKKNSRFSGGFPHSKLLDAWPQRTPTDHSWRNRFEHHQGAEQFCQRHGGIGFFSRVHHIESGRDPPVTPVAHTRESEYQKKWTAGPRRYQLGCDCTLGGEERERSTITTNITLYNNKIQEYKA